MKSRRLKSLLSLLIVPALFLGAPIGGVLADGLSIVYSSAGQSKDPSNEGFDFEANRIDEPDVVLDGKYDAVYGSPVLSYGLTTSGSYDVSMYVHRGEQALYFYFDVFDKKVTKRAIGANNAHDEDGVEISIDTLLDGGNAPQKDDLRIYLGVTGFSRVTRGTGSGWGGEIGFGGTFKSVLKSGTVPNFNVGDDQGYTLEYRLPYISISGEATKDTPLAFALVQANVDEPTGSRSRTGMSGHKEFKIPSADVPSNYIILSKNGGFYTRANYANLNENTPTVIGQVIDAKGEPMPGVEVRSHYVSNPANVIRRTTDKNGYYSIEEVETAQDFISVASKPGFAPYSVTFSGKNLLAANGAEYFQKLILASSATPKRPVQGKIVLIEGEALSGFSVYAEGYPDEGVLTDENGRYSLEVYEGIDANVIFAKKGYLTKKVPLSKDAASLDETEIYHASTTLLQPTKTDLKLNSATCGLTRYSEGILATVESTYPIAKEETASLYLNISPNAGFRGAFHDLDVRIDISENKAGVYAYSEAKGAFVLDSSIPEIKVDSSCEVLYRSEARIPYASLGLTKAQIFGAAYSFYNGADAQDSLTPEKAIVDGEIDEMSTATYARFSAEGTPFFFSSNAVSDFLYYYRGIDGAISEDIPNSADRIYVTYARSEEGLTLVFSVTDGFGTHFNTSTKLTGAEAINAVLNLDGENLGSWALFSKGKTCYDLNLRIYPDGTVCYINSTDVSGVAANQLWWSDKAHNNGVAKNLIFDAKRVDEKCVQRNSLPGLSTYSLTFTYEELTKMANAPEGAITSASPIGFGCFEISETSKTSVRFYTNSGNGWVFSGQKLAKTIGSYSSQGNYPLLPKNA